jgi:DNA-binding NarL/FixJ family response regulator
MFRLDAPAAGAGDAAVKTARGKKVVVVEDHAMFREIVVKLCTKELGLDVVAEAADGESAIAAIRAHAPQLALLDLQLPRLDGLGVIEAIADDAPQTAVLVLSSHCDEYTVYWADRLRVRGFVDKNANSVATLREAIRQVLAGHTWFSTTFAEIKAARSRDSQSFDRMLSRREQSILSLLCIPLTDAEIAVRMGISPETAAKHRFNLMRKVSAENTTALIRYARAHGFALPVAASDGPKMLP